MGGHLTRVLWVGAKVIGQIESFKHTLRKDFRADIHPIRMNRLVLRFSTIVLRNISSSHVALQHVLLLEMASRNAFVMNRDYIETQKVLFFNL